MNLKKIAVMALCVLLAVNGNAWATNLNNKGVNEASLNQTSDPLNIQMYVEGSFGVGLFKASRAYDYLSLSEGDYYSRSHCKFFYGKDKVFYPLNINVGYGVSVTTKSPLFSNSSMPILSNFLRGGSVGVRASLIRSNAQIGAKGIDHFVLVNTYVVMFTGGLNIFEATNYNIDLVAGIGVANHYHRYEVYDDEDDYDYPVVKLSLEHQCNLAYMIGVRQEVKLNPKLALTLEVNYQHIYNSNITSHLSEVRDDIDQEIDNALIMATAKPTGIIGANIGIKYYI